MMLWHSIFFVAKGFRIILAQLSHFKMEKTEAQRNGNDLAKSTELVNGRKCKYVSFKNKQTQNL